MKHQEEQPIQGVHGACISGSITKITPRKYGFDIEITNDKGYAVQEISVGPGVEFLAILGQTVKENQPLTKNSNSTRASTKLLPKTGKVFGEISVQQAPTPPPPRTFIPWEEVKDAIIPVLSFLAIVFYTNR